LLLKFFKNGRHVTDENIVENAPALPILTNFKMDMASFVNLHKVVVRSWSAFSAFPSGQNGGESKGGAKNVQLKYQFSQVEGDLHLQTP
jgi:hypothetical protein